jgi:hypothetical protein
MMNHKDVLSEAVGVLRDRGGQYGPEDLVFDRISRIATVMLDRVVTPYEVALIHVATKMGRMTSNPQKADNYVDAVNYMAFAAQFAGIKTSTAEDEEIAALARKFAPVPQPTGTGQVDQPE